MTGGEHMKGSVFDNPSTAFFVPDIPRQPLPAALRLFERVGCATCLITSVALFHQFMQFAHVQPAWTFDFLWIRFFAHTAPRWS